ncbi:MAG: SEC-C domain-containing protein [Anaerolineales bacterium]|nr:SEC-C domain-containing protein [Anaerolineales bacterium]
MKVKRNDPCPCGSGKKYKQCCLPVEQAQAKEEREWEDAAGFLRRDFLFFAREERFAKPFASGLELFFNGLHTIETAHEMSELESFRFIEWFVYDYFPDDGQRLIEEYKADKGELLNRKESDVLDGWIKAGPVSAYRLADATGEGKRTLVLQNLFDEIEHTVRNTSGPGRAEAGDVLIARLLPMRDEIRMSAATGFLPADEAADLKPFILKAWDDYKEKKPDAIWDEFLRRRSYLFAHYELDAAKKAGRPPVARLDPDRPSSRIPQVLRRGRRHR